jgi:hypothetical protein
MRSTGVLVLEGRHLRTAKILNDDTGKGFHDRLEDSFISLCKELGISVPIWLGKNTKELAMCKKTSFFRDQFQEDFIYDRFELRIDKI